MGIFERSWGGLADPENKAGMNDGQFTLERRMNDGLVYFVLRDIKCAREVLETWTNCRLVQRGQFVHPWIASERLAPGLSDVERADRIDGWVERATAATLRLEGEIEIMALPPAAPGTPPPIPPPATTIRVTSKTITIFVGQGAVGAVEAPVEQTTDLIIMKVHTRLVDSDAAVDPGGSDGSVTGDPRSGH